MFQEELASVIESGGELLQMILAYEEELGCETDIVREAEQAAFN